MRGKEQPKNSRMVELKVYRECSNKKIIEAVCHSDCLWRVLQAGQDKYLKFDGAQFWDFDELKKESRTRRLE